MLASYYVRSYFVNKMYAINICCNYSYRQQSFEITGQSILFSGLLHTHYAECIRHLFIHTNLLEISNNFYYSFDLSYIAQGKSSSYTASGGPPLNITSHVF